MSSANLADAMVRLSGVRAELRDLAQQRFDGRLSEKALQTRLRTMVWQLRSSLPQTDTDEIYEALQGVAKAHWQTLVKDVVARTQLAGFEVAIINSSEPALSRDEVAGERSRALARAISGSLYNDLSRAGATYDDLFPIVQSFLLGAWEVDRARRRRNVGMRFLKPKND
jgi:hypothetical protein